MRLFGSTRQALKGQDLRLQRMFTAWATVDPTKMTGSEPGVGQNLVGGKWVDSSSITELVDPWTGEVMVKQPNTKENEIQPFVDSLKSVPKTGLHNPFKNPDRYKMYGQITKKAAAELSKPEVTDFFTKLVQRTSPKSYTQAKGEVTTLNHWLDIFSGDSVQMLARGFSQPGDHTGQITNGVRFPWGSVGLITPFNFPLEIPSIQMLSALFMGNKPLVHVDHRVSIVNEQFIRMLHHVGMPKEDVDYLQGQGPVVGKILKDANVRSTLFTGSSKVAERLCQELRGKVFIEDAGFDWKILGPDVRDVDYVAWQCDQDAYGSSGQKCSAQSMLFMHANWSQAGILEKMKQKAAARNTEDKTIGPILTWTTEAMLEHAQKLQAIPGAKLLFGGKKIEGHKVPKQYGLIEPTAVFVPLKEALKPENFETVTKELFGPFQVVTTYEDSELDLVLEAVERMDNHLTAAIVSNDINFVNKVIGSTVNGTTYAGIRARTTGAPQNHWFGPAGDPRGAGIHTPEAIRLVWSCHREIVTDFGPIDVDVSSLKQT